MGIKKNVDEMDSTLEFSRDDSWSSFSDELGDILLAIPDEDMIDEEFNRSLDMLIAYCKSEEPNIEFVQGYDRDIRTIDLEDDFEGKLTESDIDRLFSELWVWSAELSKTELKKYDEISI